MIILVIIAALAINNLRSRSQTQTATTVAVARGTIIASIAGSGSVAAERSLDLPFQTNGIVTEVLVKEGDFVSAGQMLARLDNRDLQLQVSNAQANLDSANARLAQAQEGNARPEDLAAAQASLANAQAQYTKTRTGNITAADIASAEAALRSAQAKLDDLLAGPKPAQISSAQAKQEQARANLEQVRTNASITKSKSEQDVMVAANALRDAQDQLSKIFWQTHTSESTWKKGPDDRGYQDDVDSYNDALRTAQDAEAKLHQSQLAQQNAAAQEQTNIATAESQLRDAEEQLRITSEGATRAEIIQAQASVDQQRASLQKLRQGGTPADIAAAKANVDQAKANLEKLTAAATTTDLRIQQANVAQVEQTLKQAQLKLENATLRAPFAGIITKVTIVPGSSANSTTAAFQLIDRSTLHVDLKLSENDIAKAKLGLPVTLTIASLSGWKTQGSVSYIAPSATSTNDVVTYAVRVSFPDADPSVKVGMTANLNIITAQKDGVLLVPNTALLPKGAGHVVQAPGDNGAATKELDVQIGLSDGTQTEVLSGLNEGQRIIALPNTTTTRNNARPGFFGG